MMTLYEKLVAAGSEIEHHASDLYAKRTPTALKLVQQYEFRSQVTTFVSPLDNERWLDIPFAYDPYWARLSDTVR